MIYIIGVDHSVQHLENPDTVRLANHFKKYLKGIVELLRIDVIAEEFSKHCLHSTIHSVAESLALEIGIEHRYCDPSPEERVKLGIPSKQEIERLVKEKLMLNDSRPLSSIKIEDEVKGDGKLALQIVKTKECIEKKHWPKREKFWYEKILDIKDKNVLFICGASHVESFYNLLSEKGKQVNIIEPYWNKEEFET